MINHQEYIANKFQNEADIFLLYNINSNTIAINRTP
jgi:hypothetical protein